MPTRPTTDYGVRYRVTTLGIRNSFWREVGRQGGTFLAFEGANFVADELFENLSFQSDDDICSLD